MAAMKRIIASNIKDILKANGWEVDRYGNSKKTIGEKVYRVKYQATSCRLEVQGTTEATPYSKESKFWIRVGGDYYKNITVKNASDGTDYLFIGRYKFKVPA